MLPEHVALIVGKLPYMQLRDARIFYDLIVSHSLKSALELGFFHGVSSTYLAGALEDSQEPGHLTTIDLLTARDRNPNIQQLLEQAKLQQLVTIFYEEKSFNWRLLEFLREGRREYFDFCYLDGAHTWYDTGFAFCLVERLMAPGGWVVFDDLYFSFRESNNRDKAWVRKMPEHEQTSQQVRHVFELLVEDNSDWTNFRRIGGRFAFAQKKDSRKDETVYLPNIAAIAVSRALERAQRDPEFRNELMFASESVMSSFLPEGTLPPECLHFVESNSIGPRPVVARGDGSFTVPVEQPAWAITSSRPELEQLLGQHP